MRLRLRRSHNLAPRLSVADAQCQLRHGFNGSFQHQTAPTPLLIEVLDLMHLTVLRTWDHGPVPLVEEG